MRSYAGERGMEIAHPEDLPGWGLSDGGLAKSQSVLVPDALPGGGTTVVRSGEQNPEILDPGSYVDQWRAINAAAKAEREGYSHLSPREVNVLAVLARRKGISLDELARSLGPVQAVRVARQMLDASAVDPNPYVRQARARGEV